MHLILVRHGSSAMAADDDARTLDDTGRDEAEIVGNWLGKLSLGSPSVWHSNKVRTRETADIIIKHAGWSSKPIETQGLRPSSPVEEIVPHIEAEKTDLVIVGHMPFMSGIAAHLVHGPRAYSHWDFATCGTLILERSGQKEWIVVAFTRPALTTR